MNVWNVKMNVSKNESWQWCTFERKSTLFRWKLSIFICHDLLFFYFDVFIRLTYLLTYCTLNDIISLAWKCNSAVTLQPLFITITIDNDKSAVRLIYNNFTRVWSCIIVLLIRIHLRACNEKLFMKLWIHKVVVSNV